MMNITVRVESLGELRTLCIWYQSRIHLMEFDLKFPRLNKEVSVTDLLRYDIKTSEIPGYVHIQDKPYLEVGAFPVAFPDVLTFTDWLDLFS